MLIRIERRFYVLAVARRRIAADYEFELGRRFFVTMKATGAKPTKACKWPLYVSVDTGMGCMSRVSRKTPGRKREQRRASKIAFPFSKICHPGRSLAIRLRIAMRRSKDLRSWSATTIACTWPANRVCCTSDWRAIGRATLRAQERPVEGFPSRTGVIGWLTRNRSMT